MTLNEYPDREMLAINLANVLAGKLTATLMHEDRATLVVPGGTTPGPIFDALCDADLDWSRVDVMLSDERWVPQDDPRSNA
ncbi:MAG: 6-phosphogluconolactonase, partial [Paracoccaceae bacterium]|nr:6-phosphogluconolactonase [Paracoccaceae bacterium]